MTEIFNEKRSQLSSYVLTDLSTWRVPVLVGTPYILTQANWSHRRQ
jgi:hypothetical protein